MHSKNTARIAIGACLLISLVTVASSQVTYVGSNGDLSAQADFRLIGTGASQLLQITLTNTSSVTAPSQAQTLSALFFNFSNGWGSGAAVGANDHVNLSSALLNPSGYQSFLYTDNLYHTSQPSQIDVGYGFLGGLDASSVFGSSFSNVYGFSASGLGLFGNANFASSGSGHALNGSDYCLLPDAPFNSGIDGFQNNNHYPFVKNSVTFTVHTGGWSADSLNHIANVAFNYGTALGEGQIGGDGGGNGHILVTPEPVTSSLIGASALLFVRRRIRKSRQK